MDHSNSIVSQPRVQKLASDFPSSSSPASLYRKAKTAKIGHVEIPLFWANLFFSFVAIAGPSWSKCLVTSVDRLYKWKSFREIGGQLFRVVLCKPVVCYHIWTRDTFHSDLFTSRAR